MEDGDDEFGLLADNAAEAGLAWTGTPPVRRDQARLPDGRTVSALVWGKANPELVLVHGAAQNAHTWDTVALALGRPLVAVDLPGHGRSDWRADHDYTPGALADDLAPALSRLAPGAGLVAGMSLGGLAAIALAARHPDLVGRLVLVDVTPGVAQHKTRAVVDFVSGPPRFANFEELLERTVRHNPGRSRSSLRRGVLHNARRLPGGEWAWRWDPQRLAGAGPGLLPLAGLWEDLAGMAAPVTLVRAGASPVVDEADVAELRRRRPDAEVVVVEGAGHSVQGDRPVELAGLLAARLESPA